MQKQKSRKWLWISLVVVGVIGLVVAAPRLLSMAGIPMPQSPSGALTGAAAAQATGSTETISATVQVRSADEVRTATKATGSVVFADETPVVIDVNGTVTTLPVSVGDSVKAGDLLVAVDTVSLERALTRAQLEVQTAQNKLNQLKDPATAEDIAEAEASLASAQAKLEDVKAGPSKAELDAARASVSAAQAKYGDVTAEMSANERTKLVANLEKARVEVEKAQRSFDQVSWRGDSGATQESADLQKATIEYEAAKADYELSAEPASQGDVQSAVSSIRSAQQQLDDLLSQPNAADIASAEAQVASAQSKLDQLRNGAKDLEVQASEIQLQQALVSLEEALVKLNGAQVKAPVDGVITAVDTKVGETVGSGQAVVTIANPQDLAVEALVAEVDVAQLAEGQPAEIALDAIPGRTIAGTLTRIAPTSAGGDGAVNYKVKIQLTAFDLQGVRPGMTAVASLANQAKSGGFLVPVNALRQENGRSVVQVQRDGAIMEVEVQPGDIQGEWQVIYADGLQPTDAVVGGVTSRLDTNNNTGSMFPPRPSQMGGGSGQP